MDPSAGFWLCPTRGRSTTNLKRFVEAVVATGTTTSIVLVVDHGDDAPLVSNLPDNFSTFYAPGGSNGEAFEEVRAALWSNVPHQWIGLLSDELIPETPNWDTRLIAHLAGYNLVSTNDGAHAPKRLGGAVAFSGDLVEAVGYVYPPGLKHGFLDDVWEQLARETDNWFCDMSIMVRHARHSWGGQRDVTAIRAQGFFAADSVRYQQWLQNEKGPAIEAIQRLFERYGGKTVTPDLTGYKIMLLTPSGDGTYESVYQRSYVETRDAVRALGGQLTLAECPYLSDPALARMKLFGHFLRSDATHAFWIDADQGWRTKDFMRLLLSGRDLSAAAGVRKTFPITFAVNVSDDYGRPLGINEASSDGMMRVTHVGFAFVCTTKHWAVRMSQHYADLAFNSADGAREFGVFLPMVLNERYLGEDFACCQRWRNMGGEIFIAPEIDLEHVGRFTWSGAWLTSLVESAQRQEALQSAA